MQLRQTTALQAGNLLYLLCLCWLPVRTIEGAKRLAEECEQKGGRRREEEEMMKEKSRGDEVLYAGAPRFANRSMPNTKTHFTDKDSGDLTRLLVKWRLRDHWVSAHWPGG